jgi:hypothetical protein
MSLFGKLRRSPKSTATRHFGKNATIVFGLVAAGFVAAWLRFREHLDSGKYTDGARTYDTKDAVAVRYAVWEMPEPLGGGLNSSSSESRPAISPDGRFLVFVSGERGSNSDLYVAEMKNGEPGTPEPLTPVDTTADELSPSFSGDALYFASDRPGGAGGLDLYRAPYSNGVFGAPERLGDAVNTSADECDPAPRPGTREIVFASNRGAGGASKLDAGFDLYVADLGAAGDAARPVPLVALNTEHEEREPAFTADGRTLFFASDREHGSGDFDLYRTSRTEQGWSDPVALAGLNTGASERGPAPAFDDFSLYFAREHGEHDSNLFRARSIELYRIPGRPVGWLELSLLGSLLLLALLAWLAKKWPQVDTLYKCYLASLAVHLALFLWFRVLHPGGGTPASGPRRDTIPVRIAPGNSVANAGNRERGGSLEGGRSRGSEDASGPERIAGGLGDGSVSVPTSSVDAPTQGGPDVPQREAATGEAGPATLSTGVALADREAADPEASARRNGSAPSLALSDGPVAGSPTERSSGGGGGPERGSGTGRVDRPGGPSAGSGDVAAPRAPADSAPGRGEIALAPASSDATGMPVAIAAPNDAARKILTGGSDGNGTGGSGTKGTSAGGISLDALAGSGGERAGGPGIERLDGSGAGAGPGGTRGEADGFSSGGALSSGSIAALAPKAQTGGGSGPVRAGLGRDAGTAPRTEIGLHDAAPVPKIAGNASNRGSGNGPGGNGDGGQGGNGNGSGPGSGTGDLLGGLEGAGGLGAGLEHGSGGTSSGSGSGGGSPEKQRVTGGASASPPPALALAPPAPDRAADEPPRPEKRWEDTPYRNRAGEEKARALEVGGGTKETEEAVAKGLAYLARLQQKDGEWTGAWGDPQIVDGKYGQVAVGKTGLALLAFLGAGHTPASKTEYSENSARAVAFLLAMQDGESGHFGDSEAYSHGIATYALAECYALTGAAELRAPLERAVAHILSKQNHARDPKRFGGWSYYYTDDRTYDRWPRSSITAWQVMALESARLGGVAVPAQVFEDAATFFDNAHDEENGWYRYNHDPQRLQSNWPTLPASTPAAMFALSLVGRDLKSEDYASSRRFVLTRTPSQYRRGSSDDFVLRGQGNLYFWYYGTLAMFRVGGSEWERWNAGMKEALVRGQRKDGSWAPIDNYCEYARDGDGDRSYSTAMCVLSLEVYYRYYLPLLKVR